MLGELNEEFEAAVGGCLITIAEAVQAGKPLLGCFFPPPSELWAALDLPFWAGGVLQIKALESEDAPQILDYCGQLGITPLMCSLVRSGIYLLHTGSFPTPTMLMGATEPCDANVELWQMANEYQPWANIPKLTIDIPYEMDKMGNDDPAVSYLAEQIKASVSFVEEHSGLKMDLDRLKEVCEESNRACQLRLEFQELRRTVPTPVSCVWDNMIMIMSGYIGCGKPDTTRWIQKLVDATEKRVREGKGIEGVTEKVRLLWYDFAPTWGPKLFPRLAKDFGAVVIVELGGWCPPLEAIDTSTEKTVYKSLAKIYATAPPMVRQGMTSLDQYCNDLVRIVNDFKIDAVILPSHLGHRNTNSLVKICTDVCREIGVPSLFLACDIWDERPMPPDEVYEKIGRFLYAMNLA
jgi:benzoyl-CoA reductase/2-hydroxyglutaryl-CoA dehydratase subunit BcrC/BadD/HgdB